MKVLCFGDSLVVGRGDPEGLGWVGRAEAAARASGVDLEVRNFGVPGETSTEIVSRWRGQADPEVRAGGPVRVVFSVGANDATVEGGRLLVEPEVSRQNLRGALAESARLGLPGFVVGPAPIEDDTQHERIVALSDDFAGICREAAVPYVAVARALIVQGDWVREARGNDGAHPGTAGYAAMAALILPAWLAWLAAPLP